MSIGNTGASETRMSTRWGNLAVTWAAAAALVFAGCATVGGKHAAPASKSAEPVTVQESTDLPDLAKGIKTRDDSLILDMLLGYRMLLLRNPDPKTLDKETLTRSREAYDRLENALRHGGLRSQDAGERVYTITNEQKLSLQEVIRSASQAAEKDAHAGDWDKAKARWKEILQSKQAVAWTMEEAQWGLALSDALDSQLPDAIKKKLKDVNDSYAAENPQDEIGKQVKDLLDQVQDEKLRRELKKLANRAWERDKRAGRLAAGAVGDTGAPSQPAAAAAGMLPPPQPSTTQPAVPAPAGAGDSAAAAQVDTLVAQGKYIAALKALDNAHGDANWIKQKRAQVGDRFCEERRKDAANSFKDFKSAAGDASKRALLKRTAADLDSCLFYFPDISVAEKVRRNRAMVEGELKKLKE